MPVKLKLEMYHSLEIAFAKLSPKMGCGLMLKSLPRYDSSDALNNIMGTYSYSTVCADKPAQKILDNSGLLKSFYDNAFMNKVPLRQNFRQVYGHLDIYMANDPAAKTVWFVADPMNRVALANYHRDATSLGLKTSGIALIGSTIKLTAAGWQNLHDLLNDDFLSKHRAIGRVEVMSVMAGVRWREPCLGLGVTLLNIREQTDVLSAVEAAMRGESGGEIHN